jgi:hypothetical protein
VILHIKTGGILKTLTESCALPPRGGAAVVRKRYRASVYESKGPARKATLLKQLIQHKMREDDDVREHVARFMDTVDKLQGMSI